MHTHNKVQVDSDIEVSQTAAIPVLDLYSARGLNDQALRPLDVRCSVTAEPRSHREEVVEDLAANPRPLLADNSQVSRGFAGPDGASDKSRSHTQNPKPQTLSRR